MVFLSEDSRGSIGYFKIMMVRVKKAASEKRNA